MYYVYIVIMTIIGAFASFLLKKASGFQKLKDLLSNINLYLGVILYLAAAIINIFVLKHMPYSVVLPLTSFTYIWTSIIAYFALKETLSLKKIAGVVFIVIGALVLVQ